MSMSWWVSPKGKIISFSPMQEHAGYVIKHPRVFGLTSDDVHNALARSRTENYIWNLVIRHNKWIRIAEYSFGYNVTVPDLSNRTKNAIYVWVTKEASYGWASQSKVSIDEYNGILQFGDVGQYKTTIARIVKNFDFGDGVQEARQSIREAVSKESLIVGNWNRRFLYGPKKDRIFLGSSDIKGESHSRDWAAATGSNVGFDETVRGWVGRSTNYKNGIIHFSPQPGFEQSYVSFLCLENFVRNFGANLKTVVRNLTNRGFEQPLGSVISGLQESGLPLKPRQPFYEAVNRGYWITDKGEHFPVGDEAVGPFNNTHTAYLRRNKLFSGDRFDVAIRKGWIAARYFSGKWALILNKLDSKTRDLVWDWARDLQSKRDIPINIYVFGSGYPSFKTTTQSIVKRYDFGDGFANESFMRIINNIVEEVSLSLLAKLNVKFPPAGSHVSDIKVTDNIPNLSSISASLYRWETLGGVREVRMSQMDPTNTPSKDQYTLRLSSNIKESRWIDPLIVVVDSERYPYILEGGHRYDALRLLKVASFPALVVVDTENL